MDGKYYPFRDRKFISIPTIDELCLSLKEKFERQEETIRALQKENGELKSGIWEKEEVARLKNDYDQMQKDYFRGFPISEKEQATIREWKLKHDEEKHNAKTIDQRIKLEGVSGGRFTYEFTPTTIGTVGKVKCSCGECFTFADLV